MSEPKQRVMAEGVPLALLYKRELKLSPGLVMLSQPRSVHAERIRRLKTTLAHQYGDDLKVIVVTSSVPGEGKSTVSVNLAVAFAADSGQKVLLVDADLRRPTIGKMLEPAPHLGMTELLTGRTELAHAVLHLKNSPLHVLPAGEKTSNPLELFASEEADTLMTELRSQYDRVIIDTPPIVPFADADALGSRSDGVIMVVRAGVTPASVFHEGISAVTSARILGTILNGTTTNLADRRGSYDNYYRSYYDGDGS